MSPARILVVDNDPWIQRMLATVLGQGGHLVNLEGVRRIDEGKRAAKAES